MDSFRIQKIHEQVESLDPEDTVLDPPKFDGGAVQDPEYDLLSEIINQVNNTYGINLTEDDKVDIERLRDRLNSNSEIQKYMTGNNTEDNKRSFLRNSSTK